MNAIVAEALLRQTTTRKTIFARIAEADAERRAFEGQARLEPMRRDVTAIRANLRLDEGELDSERRIGFRMPGQGDTDEE